MKIETILKGQGVTLDFDAADIRAALDYTIRHDKAAWELVRDVAGNYQAELMQAELKRRKAPLHKKVKS